MEGHIPNGIPPFNGNNYAYWSKRIQNFLISLGVDIWLSFVNGYKVPKNTPIDLDEKKLTSFNSNARYVIISGLAPNLSSKVIGCSTTKEVWDQLQNIYEDNLKVKHVKIQQHRAQLENLKINEK
jgi:hypothetical protein